MRKYRFGLSSLCLNILHVLHFSSLSTLPLTFSTATFVFFYFPLSMSFNLNRLSKLESILSFLIEIKGGFLCLLKRTSPPYVATKLSIPEGLPCYTFSNNLEILFTSFRSRLFIYCLFPKISINEDAKIVLNDADEPKHLPIGISDFISINQSSRFVFLH